MVAGVWCYECSTGRMPCRANTSAVATAGALHVDKTVSAEAARTCPGNNACSQDTPEMYPATTDEWAEPLEGDDAGVAVVRPLLAGTNLREARLRQQPPASPGGWPSSVPASCALELLDLVCPCGLRLSVGIQVQDPVTCSGVALPVQATASLACRVPSPVIARSRHTLRPCEDQGGCRRRVLTLAIVVCAGWRTMLIETGGVRRLFTARWTPLARRCALGS